MLSDEKKDVKNEIVVVNQSPVSVENKVDLPDVPSVSDDFNVKDLLGGSDDSDVTKEQIIHKLGVIDENLSMKTEINNVQATSSVELVAEINRLAGKKIVAKVYDKIIHTEKVNAVSKKRLGRKETIDGYVAVAIQEIHEKKSALDDAFGGRK